MADYVTSQQFDKFLKEETEHHERSEAAGQKRGEEISKINSKLDSIDRWRARTESTLTAHSDELKALRKTMYGNGIPGWDEMLRTLYTDYQERKEADKEARKSGTLIDKEIRLMGIKMTAETRLAFISGAFILLNGVVTWWLSK